jgi:hypothetical protein
VAGRDGGWLLVVDNYSVEAYPAVPKYIPQGRGGLRGSLNAGTRGYVLLPASNPWRTRGASGWVCQLTEGRLVTTLVGVLVLSPKVCSLCVQTNLSSAVLTREALCRMSPGPAGRQTAEKKHDEMIMCNRLKEIYLRRECPED